MKWLYERYFYVPKHGKVEDRVMLSRAVTTATIMILCLAVMSLSAYAYFSHTITAGSNVIKAADFDVSVTLADGTAKTVEANANGTYSLPGGTYAVSLEKGGTAKTGFCVVEVTLGTATKTYHTQQLGVDGEKERLTLDFTLVLSGVPDGATATVTFTPHWGTSHYYGEEDADTNPLYIKGRDTVAFSGVGTIGDPEPETTTTTTTVTVPTGDTYTVVKGDNLAGIAKLYGIDMERLAAYNGIADPTYIEAGKTLKIPPADWQMPVETTTKPTTTTTAVATTVATTTTTATTTTATVTTTLPTTTATTETTEEVTTTETAVTTAQPAE